MIELSTVRKHMDDCIRINQQFCGDLEWSMVITTAIWGHKWVGKTVRPLCDNMAVVHSIRIRQNKDHNAMHLMRYLALIECSFHFTFVSRHIPGKHNDLADGLSRNNLPHFVAHYTQAHPTPTPMTTSLYKALIS